MGKGPGNQCKNVCDKKKEKDGDCKIGVLNTFPAKGDAPKISSHRAMVGHETSHSLPGSRDETRHECELADYICQRHDMVSASRSAQLEPQKRYQLGLAGQISAVPQDGGGGMTSAQLWFVGRRCCVLVCPAKQGGRIRGATRGWAASSELNNYREFIVYMVNADTKKVLSF